MDEQGLVGALWPGGGQYTNVWSKSDKAEQLFDHAKLSVYRQDKAEFLLNQLQEQKTFEALQNRLQALGFHIVEIEEYIVN